MVIFFNGRKIFDVFDEKHIYITAININIYTFNQKISDEMYYTSQFKIKFTDLLCLRMT